MWVPKIFLVKMQKLCTGICIEILNIEKKNLNILIDSD